MCVSQSTPTKTEATKQAGSIETDQQIDKKINNWDDNKKIV